MTLKYISSINISHANELSKEQAGRFDVISFQSKSYAAQRQPFQIPAGDGEGRLPVALRPSVPLLRRFRGKRMLQLQDMRPSQRAPSQTRRTHGHGSQPSSSQPKKSVLNDMIPFSNRAGQQTPEQLYAVKTQAAENLLSDEQMIANVSALRKHLKEYGNCIGVQMFVQDLPPSLKDFLWL